MNEEVSSEKLIETGSKKLINSEALDNEVQVTFFQVFFGDNYQGKVIFYPNLSVELKKKLVKAWRKIVLATVFIGIMKSFQNNVKIFGAIRQCDHMQGIEEQRIEDSQIKRRWCIIYPNDTLKNVWNILLVGMLILTGLMTPFIVCFIESKGYDVWFGIDVVFDSFFLADLIINFLSAYEDDEKKIVDEPKKIAIEYLSGWFLIDCSAVLPINYFLPDDSTSNSARYNKLLRLLRLPRLYRLLRLLKLQKNIINIKNKTNFARLLSSFGINEGVIKGLLLLSKILFINHLVACFWYFLARMSNFDDSTWVAKKQLLDSPLYTKYIASYEWSLQTLTTVGYGDIEPSTIDERIFAIIWMIFGTGFFSYTLGKLSSILENVDKKWAEFEKRMHLFNDFAVRVQLPYALKTKVHKYYRNNYLKNVYSSLDPKKLIQELPSQIKNELLLICYQFLQDSVSILQIDDNFTATLLPHLNFLEIQTGEIIYRQDDPATDIYFIEKGKVNFVTNDRYNLITLLEASFFGEIEAFEGRNREYFAVAKEPTNLFFCSSQIFIDLLKEFPNVAEDVLLIVNRRKQKYKICIQMIELQRKRNANQPNDLLKNSTQHYLTLIDQYENEKHKLQQDKGSRSQRKNSGHKRSVLEAFSFKNRLAKNNNQIVPIG